MAIDPSIYNQIQQPKFESPVNALAQISQVRNAQNQNRLTDMQIANIEREQGAENALAGLLAGGGDAASVAKGLADQGYAKQSMAYTKQNAEAMKAQREEERAKFLQAKDQISLIGQVAGAAKDQQSYSAGREALRAAGIDISQIPEQYDPSYVNQAMRQALTAEQQINDEWKRKGFDLDKDKFAYQKQNDAANRGVTIRGQNMTDARGRDLAAATREAGGRAPAGYRYAADGRSLEPIPGGPAMKDKAPTEFQGKSATFGARAEQADKTINDLSGKYSVTGLRAQQGLASIPLIGGALGAAGNVALSAEQQKVDQAERDFVNAVLRQESGAAISAGEFDNARKQYFPQPGDSSDVIKQKAQNRSTAIEGFKKNAGSAAYTATQRNDDLFSAADAILNGRK